MSPSPTLLSLFYFSLLLCFTYRIQHITCYSTQRRLEMRQKAREMFEHGYNSYMTYAFPHDELKPLSLSYTDSLGELGHHGNARITDYNGVALSMIDALSTLAVMQNTSEFTKAVNYLSTHLTFDLDLRVNVFEANIRLLGGLLSAHILARDENLGLMQDEYHDELLNIAHDLGLRLIAAFDGTSDMPYAWVHLRSGVDTAETREQCVAGVGTLLLEFGMLSHLTGDKQFFIAADRALSTLWNMRSALGLFGNTFDGISLTWINPNSGIGAGIDSMYEYLFKSYLLFGNTRYLDMYQQTYESVQKYLRSGHWYVEADMSTGAHTHIQFNSLQAFWPGLQVLAGSLSDAIPTLDAFYSIWQRFDSLPERFLLHVQQPHATERYYPLRPEFVESTYYMYRATRHPKYLEIGERIYYSLHNYTRVAGGFASVRNVENKELEDRMPSFFLAETCKYLYLLFDESNFAHSTDFLFTTEGHLFPLTLSLQKQFGDDSIYGNGPHTTKRARQYWMTRMNQGVDIRALGAKAKCPRPDVKPPTNDWDSAVQASHALSSSDHHAGEQCIARGGELSQGDYRILVGEGSFHIQHISGETLDLRNLGTHNVELTNYKDGKVKAVVLEQSGEQASASLFESHITIKDSYICPDTSVDAIGALFGPSPISSGTQVQFTITPGQGARILHVPNHRISGSLFIAHPPQLCEPHTGGLYHNKIVLIERGTCTFMDKVIHAQNAGAIGVIIVNTADEYSLFMMGPDDSEREIKIPSMMISKHSYNVLKECLERKGVGTVMSDGRTWDGNTGFTIEMDKTMIQLGQPTYAHTPVATATRGSASVGVPGGTGGVTPTNYMIVAGNLSKFRVTTLGGWVVEVEEQNRSYLLKLH